MFGQLLSTNLWQFLASKNETLSSDIVQDRIRVSKIYLESGDLAPQDAEYVNFDKFKEIMSKNDFSDALNTIRFRTGYFRTS